MRHSSGGVRGLLHGALVDEVRDSLFEGCSGGEGPNKGPLSLDRDLRGGIGEGLGEHVAGVRGELDLGF